MKKLFFLLLVPFLIFSQNKIEIKNNYFILTDAKTNDVIHYPKSMVRIEDSADKVFFLFENSNIKYSYKYNEITVEGRQAFTSKADFLAWAYNNTGSIDITKLADTDLGLDVWGVPKFSKDVSVLSGMFTNDVPVSTWYETFNGTVRAFTNCTSVNGGLNVVAGANLNDVTNLRTFRNPRYEPNRGQLYSTAGFMVSPNAAMDRSWGLGTTENRVYFKLASGTLKGVVRTTKTGVTTESEILLDTTGVDLSKGNIYDLRFQWRGVGNYFFYINKKLVGYFNNLGSLTDLSMSNPALPIFFESKNLGDNAIMRFGCVDVTSENGKDDGKTYGSISIDNNSGQLVIPAAYNVPVLVVRNKLTVNGRINTRDVLAMVLSAYADERAFIRVWKTRDATAITLNNQTWRDYGDGHLEFLQYDNPDVATPISFDTSKATIIYGCRVNADETFETRGLYDKRTEIYQTPGDILIFTLHKENAQAMNGGVTYQFAEQI